MAQEPGWIDFLPLGVIVFSAVVVFLAGNSKKLKCPGCGTVFAAPSVDIRKSGAGWTLPYMGKVKCPKCGESRSRRGYQKAPPQSKAPA